MKDKILKMSSGGKTRLLIGAGIGALAAVGVAAYFFTKLFNHKKKPETPPNRERGLFFDKMEESSKEIHAPPKEEPKSLEERFGELKRVVQGEKLVKTFSRATLLRIGEAMTDLSRSEYQEAMLDGFRRRRSNLADIKAFCEEDEKTQEKFTEIREHNFERLCAFLEIEKADLEAQITRELQLHKKFAHDYNKIMEKIRILPSWKPRDLDLVTVKLICQRQLEILRKYPLALFPGTDAEDRIDLKVAYMMDLLQREFGYDEVDLMMNEALKRNKDFVEGQRNVNLFLLQEKNDFEDSLQPSF